jgi:hypothetical protein
VNGRHEIGEVLEAVAHLAFRHPSTDDEAVLTADRIRGPGDEPWWRISLDCAPGSPPAEAGLRTIVWCATATMARRAFAGRQRARRAAGYVRGNDSDDALQRRGEPTPRRSRSP